MVRFPRLATVVPVLTALALVGCASDGGGVQSQKMATIKGRGTLICGVDGKLPGFSFVGSDGSYSGLDVDVCKAVAAALFGDPAKVDYRDLNSSERFAALASGEVDLMSMALSLAQPFLQDGKVRLIGYCGPQRHAQFRDIPTLQEQGVKGYDYSSWIGLFFHKDVPSEVGAVLAREAQAIGEDREFQVQLIRSGLEPWPRSAQELGRIVREDFVRWKSIIEQARIQA